MERIQQPERIELSILFAKRLRHLITDLLKQDELGTIQVESRVKTIASFSEKAARKNYENPLRQTTDLVGIRIVSYYLEDVERIGEILAREFHVYRDQCVKKAAELGIDQFGYQSDHYIISIGESRKQLVEWSRYTELKAEVQVRTALQHAWAAVDHKLNYKKVDDIPKELQRRLVRLSALFELADQEFSAIRAQRADILAEHSQDVARGNLSAEIDDLSFIAYLKNIQGNILVYSSGGLFKVEEMLDTSVRPILGIMRNLKIFTVEDLQDIIGDDWRRNNFELRVMDECLAKFKSLRITTVHYAVAMLLMLRAHDRVDFISKSNILWQAILCAGKKLGYIPLDHDGDAEETP